MAFVKYIPEHGYTSHFDLSISNKGRIYIKKHILKKPDAKYLEIHKNNRTTEIALKFVKEKADGSWKAKVENKGYSVSLYPVLKRLNLLPEKIAYPKVIVKGDMIIFDSDDVKKAKK